MLHITKALWGLFYVLILASRAGGLLANRPFRKTFKLAGGLKPAGTVVEKYIAARPDTRILIQGACRNGNVVSPFYLPGQG